jgi:hypothetical protein
MQQRLHAFSHMWKAESNKSTSIIISIYVHTHKNNISNKNNSEFIKRVDKFSLPLNFLQEFM